MILLYILSALLILLAVYAVFLGICSVLVDPDKEYNTNSAFYRFLLNSATGAALKLLRVRVHISGTEQLVKGEKMLFVCNHRSNFDPLITWYALRQWKIAFVSKPENFKIPIFGRIIRKCCFMPIDRENPRKAIPTVNRAAKLLEKQEVSVGIYPEGTRSKDGRLLPFHNGVFKIAQKAEASIAVLSITGTEKIHKRTPWHKTDVYLDVLDVLPGSTAKTAKTQTIGMMARHLILTNTEKREYNGERICDL